MYLSSTSLHQIVFRAPVLHKLKNENEGLHTISRRKKLQIQESPENIPILFNPLPYIIYMARVIGSKNLSCCFCNLRASL